MVNLARFLLERGIGLAAVAPVTVFEWINWQGVRREPASAGAGRASRQRTAAASTVNRRVAAVRALFEYLVMAGDRDDNPVPTPRRGQGLRPPARGLLGPGRPRGGGRLVRQPALLPESLDAAAVEALISSLRTHRDRAMV